MWNNNNTRRFSTLFRLEGCHVLQTASVARVLEQKEYLGGFGFGFGSVLALRCSVLLAYWKVVSCQNLPMLCISLDGAGRFMVSIFAYSQQRSKKGLEGFDEAGSVGRVGD